MDRFENWKHNDWQWKTEVLGLNLGFGREKETHQIPITKTNPAKL